MTTKTIFITDNVNFKFSLANSIRKTIFNGKLDATTESVLISRNVEYTIDDNLYITLFNIKVSQIDFYIDLINFYE